MTALYLASQSPRRRELLTQIGVQHQVLSVSVEECRDKDESPLDYVRRLACEKSAAGWQALETRELAPAPVLGADTIVVCNGQVMEKPADEAHAIAMLRQLSGSVHQVFTAVAITCGEVQKAVVSKTDVTFTEISDVEASRYWQTGEPQDKAGGYGIQGAGALFVERIEGSYSGVVGLPLFETRQLLNEFDVSVWQFEPELDESE